MSPGSRFPRDRRCGRLSPHFPKETTESQFLALRSSRFATRQTRHRQVVRQWRRPAEGQSRERGIRQYGRRHKKWRVSAAFLRLSRPCESRDPRPQVNAVIFDGAPVPARVGCALARPVGLAGRTIVTPLPRAFPAQDRSRDPWHRHRGPRIRSQPSARCRHSGSRP